MSELQINSTAARQLTADNAVLFRNQNGLPALRVREEDGSETVYERVVPVCAFPLTEPDDFISLREPDSPRRHANGEIGYLRRISDLGEASEQLLREELGHRYFTPELQKIHSYKDKFGFIYWDAETTAGSTQITLTNPASNIRTLDDGRILITDTDSNVYIVTDPGKLDRQTARILSVYL